MRSKILHILCSLASFQSFTSVLSVNDANSNTDSTITSQKNMIHLLSTTSETFYIEPNTIDYSSTYYYDDCSIDSQLYREGTIEEPMQFTCTNAIKHGGICMVNKCPLNFYDHQIAHFCQTSNETELLLDFRLSIPVTSKVTNFTYRNAFCAYCNDERHYTFWKVLLSYTPESSNASEWNNTHHKFNIESILSNLKVNENHSGLISNINDTNFECFVHGLPPKELEEFLHYCNDTFLEKIYKVSPVDFYDEHLPRFVQYNITECFISNNKLYFQFRFGTTSSTEVSGQEKQSCISATERTACASGYRLIKNRHFQFIENETILVSKSGITFGSAEWSDTFDKNDIFLCQTAFKRTDFVISYTSKLILEAFSIVFFLLLLRTIGTKKERQNLPNKVIFSYSLTMLILQITTSASFWLSSCKVAGPITHYLRLSRYNWLSILAFDFCRMIYYPNNTLEQISNRPHLKRFSIYCLIGWISPFLILFVALYLELSNHTLCRLRPEYGRLIFCQMMQEKAMDYFENYPVYVTSGIIIILYLNSLYRIYFFSSKTYFESRENFRIVVKLVWTLGLAFLIVILPVFFPSSFCRLFFSVFDQSQGVILYFIHDRTYIFENICKKFKSSKNAPTNDNFDMHSINTS